MGCRITVRRSTGGALQILGLSFLCLLIVLSCPPIASASESLVCAELSGLDAYHLNPVQKKLRVDAEAGSAEAQFQLGLVLENGNGIAQNKREARCWFEKSAAQGHAKAQNMVGAMLIANATGDHDRLAGVALLRKSAEQGVASAQYNLGLSYQYGWGVAQNEIAAVAWFQKAAAQNESAANFWVGRAREMGLGLPRSEELAVSSYRKGADLGDAAAQFALGAMYSAGRGGLPASAAEMLHWTALAADQGLSAAMYNLGVIYEKGLGVPADYGSAHVWFNLAAARGVVEAQEGRGRVEKLMAPNQIAEAQRRSSEWRPKSAMVSASAPSKPAGTKKAGSGFYVSRSGHLLTNNHVSEGCRELIVQPERLKARVVATDPVNDLALLATDNPVKEFARFRSGRNATLGEEITVVGFPLRGMLASGINVTTGVISGLGGVGADTGKIQISAPIQVGNSGGPVIDRYGVVVGIVYGKVNALDLATKTGDLPQNINFAINLPSILSFLDSHGVDYVRVPAGGEKSARSKASPSVVGQRYTRVVECVE